MDTCPSKNVNIEPFASLEGTYEVKNMLSL